MTYAFPKLLAAVAAAALFAASPVSAQTGTAGQAVSPSSPDVMSVQEFNQQVTPEHRVTMGETFRGLAMADPAEADFDVTVGATVPETAVRHPMPPEIISTVPHTQGYEYFVLADGRIVLVHPQDHTIAMILD